jgi:hypothetical protein
LPLVCFCELHGERYAITLASLRVYCH